MKLTKFQKDVIRALARRGILGSTESEVIKALLDRAIHDLVVTEYVRKLLEFRESLKKL